MYEYFPTYDTVLLGNKTIVFLTIDNSVRNINFVRKSSFILIHKFSYLSVQQSQHIDYIILEYEKHRKPQISDYSDFTCMIPDDTRSFEKSHVTDIIMDVFVIGKRQNPRLFKI